MCSLDYDGTPANTEKNFWFQGRAIWVYSFLYNHFGKNPQYLEVARKTKEFVFKYALQKDGWWAEELSREGKVLRPFSGDTEGMYYLAEGLHEYATASRRRPVPCSRRGTPEEALPVLRQPGFPVPGSGFPVSVGYQALPCGPRGCGF